MNSIIDSNVFIATWHKSEERSENAVSILKQFAEEKIKTLYITDFVIIEVINFLLRKLSYNDALGAYDFLTKTDRIRIRYADELFLLDIEKLFKIYKSLSITDCSLIALAEELSVKSIYSFDTGLDKVKSITRIES